MAALAVRLSWPPLANWIVTSRRGLQSWFLLNPKCQKMEPSTPCGIPFPDIPDRCHLFTTKSNFLLFTRFVGSSAYFTLPAKYCQHWVIRDPSSSSPASRQVLSSPISLSFLLEFLPQTWCFLGVWVVVVLSTFPFLLFLWSFSHFLRERKHFVSHVEYDVTSNSVKSKQLQYTVSCLQFSVVHISYTIRYYCHAFLIMVLEAITLLQIYVPALIGFT